MRLKIDHLPTYLELSLYFIEIGYTVLQQIMLIAKQKHKVKSAQYAI
jgi:hypothetical protein